MTLTRLFVAALVFCALPALAQDQRDKLPLSASADSSTSPTSQYFVSAPSERPITTPQSQLPSEDHIVNGLPDGRRTIHGLPLQFPRAAVLQSQADTTCFTIHRLKVARDSKDSDATHAVSSSTCLPSSQYQVKSTVLRESSDH
jgi:hypothetical protein